MSEVAEMPAVKLKDQPFKINVGERGTDHYLGRLEKKQGNAITDGPIAKGQPISGRVMFPNYFAIWGRRVAKGIVPKGRTQVEVTDSDYVGEIEYLDPSDRRGYTIYCMYRKGIYTLDYQYQVLRLHQPTIDRLPDDSMAYINLLTGEMDVEPSKDKPWSDMIQLHYMNQDSPSATIQPVQHMFKLVRELNTDDEDVKDMIMEDAAVLVVSKASASFEELTILRIIAESRQKIEWDSKKQNTLFVALRKFAKSDPKNFFEAVNEYKRNVSDTLSKLESYEVLDYEVSGKIVVRKPRTEIIFEDSTIPDTAEAMNAWIFERSMKPGVFEMIEKLTTISKSLK